MPQKLIAGNWKMNGLTADGLQLAGDTVRRVGGDGSLACDILICPPFTLLAVLRETLSGSAIALGGQDCHPAAAGAHTGDVSARMLADLGCSYVIVGHSERRHDHGESDSLVKAKAEAALAAGVTPIICVGETESERDSGQALAVIGQQVRASLPSGEAAGNLVLAYEPVWAIGTGRTASPEDVAEAHAEIRRLLREIRPDRAEEVRLLYGGSVKPGNAAELLATENVDGALVGGASLVCEDFLAIARSCP